MATKLLELTADIVIAHVSVTEISPDELVKEIKMVYTTLEALEKGDTVAPTIETSIREPKKRGRKPKALPESIKEPIETFIREPKKRGRKPKALTESIKEPEGLSQPVIKAAEPVEKKPDPQAPALTLEEAFQPDEVACMICGKKGMKTLKRHLTSEHNMKPRQYRKQFNIANDQPLAATAYVEKRRQMALDRGLGDKLAKAREARKQKKQEQTTEE